MKKEIPKSVVMNHVRFWIDVEEVEWKDIKIGDYIWINFSDAGRIAKKGQTLIHRHHYVDVLYSYQTSFYDCVSKKKRIFKHNFGDRFLRIQFRITER